MKTCYICKEKVTEVIPISLSIENKYRRVTICKQCNESICHCCGEKLTKKEMKFNNEINFNRYIPVPQRLCLECLKKRIIDLKMAEAQEAIKKVTFSHDYLYCSTCGKENDSKYDNGDIMYKSCNVCRTKRRDLYSLKYRSVSTNSTMDRRGERKVF